MLLLHGGSILLRSEKMQYPIDRVGARRSAPGGRKQKYFLSPEGRVLMIEKYDGSSKAINELIFRLNVPREVIKRWASAMGLTGKKRDTWTEDDIKFLRRNIHKKSLVEISQHVGKATNTIRQKAIRMGLYKLEDDTGYSQFEVQIGLGVSNRKIARWVQLGWLKVSKVKSGVNNERWNFTDKGLRDFIIDHPDELNPQEFDWLWVVDILSGKGLGRLDAVYERE
jgi:hypothetical protein